MLCLVYTTCSTLDGDLVDMSLCTIIIIILITKLWMKQNALFVATPLVAVLQSNNLKLFAQSKTVLTRAVFDW